MALPDAVWQDMGHNRFRFHIPGFAVLGYVHNDGTPISKLPDTPPWVWEARTMDNCRSSTVVTKYNDVVLPIYMPFYGRAWSLEGGKIIVETLLKHTHTYPGRVDPRRALLDKQYIDLQDSGDAVMTVIGTVRDVSDEIVVKHPDGRCWSRNYEVVGPLVLKYAIKEP